MISIFLRDKLCNLRKYLCTCLLATLLTAPFSRIITIALYHNTAKEWVTVDTANSSIVLPGHGVWHLIDSVHTVVAS